MELMIQDPTYVASMRLGEALIDACNNGQDGAGAFAFAEENGIDLFLGDSDFSKYIKTYKYKLVVGTDSITDSKAVARLRAYCKRYPNLTVYGYVHDSKKYLFHPKIVWFKTASGGLSIVGSGNLTERGMYYNIEMYSYNELNDTEFAKLKSNWQDWLEYSIDNNLIFDINDLIIDHAVNLSAAKKAKAFTMTKSSGEKKIAPDSSLLALYNVQPKLTSLHKPSSIPAHRKGKTEPQKSTSIIPIPIPAVKPVIVPSTISPIWTVSDTDRILVAEVPKASARWKQINFNKASFQNYFGATPGGTRGTYRILLKSVNSAGELGATESRPSVSVASHNWRFEISAANGLLYPSGANRPYVIFSEASTRSFLYELLMPGDSRYSEVDSYVNSWKKANGVSGITRFITDVKTIKSSTPSLGLWKI